MIEIAVQDVAGARIAHDAGADRIELCSALDVGGLTPSIGLIEACVEVGIPVHVLVRPRPGDFVYDADEMAVIERDIRRVVHAGAAGVVVGALTAGSAELDVEALRAWAVAAREDNPAVQVTIHRCVDVLLRTGTTPRDLAVQVTSIGDHRGGNTNGQGTRVNRILTSGGAATVQEGQQALMELQSHFSSLASSAFTLVEVMAGGGVRPEDVANLREFGIYDVHLSARVQSETGPTGPGGGTDSRDVTDPMIVAAAVRAARDAT